MPKRGKAGGRIGERCKDDCAHHTNPLLKLKMGQRFYLSKDTTRRWSKPEKRQEVIYSGNKNLVVIVL